MSCHMFEWKGYKGSPHGRLGTDMREFGTALITSSGRGEDTSEALGIANRATDPPSVEANHNFPKH